MNNELIEAFECSLFEPTFSAALEYVELGLDEIIDNDAIKQLPIVNTVVGIGKTVYSIHERHLMKKLAIFIKEFNSGKIKTEKLEKYRNKMKNDSKKAEKELGRVLILLDKMIDDVKSKMIAQLYQSYINEMVNWEKFCELSDTVERLNISDIELLYKINSGEINSSEKCPLYQIGRLESIGLITSDISSMGIGGFGSSKTNKYLRISELGEIFCDLVKLK